jgi:hypothetical protein
MTNTVYNKFKANLASGNINMYDLPVKVMLVGNSYTFSHNHSVTGDVIGEIVSSNYALGGMALPNKAVGINSVTNQLYLSGSTVSYAGVTADIFSLILYVSGSLPSTNYLIACVDELDISVDNATLNISWNDSEILLF